MNELMSGVAVKDVSTLTLPLWASDKEDGIRCAIIQSPRTDNRLVASRTFKPIQNIHVRHTIHNSCLPIGVDGELVSGNNFQDTASAIMSADGTPEFKYRVFDFFDDVVNRTYKERFKHLSWLVSHCRYPWLELLPQRICATHDDVNAALADALARGKEGIMLRCPTSCYTSGRATLKSQALLKLKPFHDADAQVIGFTELVHKDRPSMPGNTLGALTCRTPTGIVFNVGTGFSEADRKEIWNNKERYYHNWITYKSQHHGVKIAPRAPVFLRWKLDHNI